MSKITTKQTLKEQADDYYENSISTTVTQIEFEKHDKLRLFRVANDYLVDYDEQRIT